MLSRTTISDSLTTMHKSDVVSTKFLLLNFLKQNSASYSCLQATYAAVLIKLTYYAHDLSQE